MERTQSQHTTMNTEPPTGNFVNEPSQFELFKTNKQINRTSIQGWNYLFAFSNKTFHHIIPADSKLNCKSTLSA